MIYFQMLPLLIYIVTTSVPVSTKGIPCADLPPNVVEWQETNTFPTATAEWSINNETCYSWESCFGIVNDGVTDDAMEAQLPPLQLQRGTPLRFSTSKHLPFSVKIQPFWVTEENFRSCNSSDGLPLVPNFTSDDIIVQQSILRPGVNYFIAVSPDPLLQCILGLRLNVTIKEEQCRLPGHTRMCNDRGRCITSAFQDKFECSCCHGYSGTYCEGLDACAKKPCLGNAICIDDVKDLSGTNYTCTCPVGYYGELCDKRVDDLCTTFPCQNNATCVGNMTSYTCHCPSGFKGRNCEVNINECSDHPCVNGVCVDQVDGYKCYCVPGHGGNNCEIRYNECLSNPCLNGKCIDIENGWQCHCDVGYTGVTCSERIPLCDPSPCQNAVECADYTSDYTCTCKPGFTGKNCEININECESSPCQNYATCVDLIAGFKCICHASYMGNLCQEPAHPELERPPDLLHYPGSVSGRWNHIHNLWIIAGTLAGALIIAMLVMAICYCRFYGLHGPMRQFQYQQHNEEIRERTDSVSKARPSLDAILDASKAEPDGTSQNVPLVAGLRSQKV